MENLVASLFAQLTSKPREQRASLDELDEFISRLKQQQHVLEQRLSTESYGTRRRRLKIALEAAQLQQKKAIALRMNLPQL
jgi:hypothetical protein